MLNGSIDIFAFAVDNSFFPLDQQFYCLCDQRFDFIAENLAPRKALLRSFIWS